MNANCDICGKSVIITPTVNRKIDADGLLINCKSCWMRKGWIRDKYFGQIQEDVYLANT